MVWKSERWKDIVESSNIEGKHVPIDPEEISIRYARGAEGEKTEVVYEDRTEEEETKPRLLVSLKSVLKMKELCEHEHARSDLACETLSQCRTAYYKEIRWLRDHVKRLVTAQNLSQSDKARARRNSAVDISDYEVYWFEPPKYVEPDLQEFLKTCIRETCKKLIEELQLAKDKAAQDEALVREANANMQKLLDAKLEMEKMEAKLNAEKQKTQRESDRADEFEQKVKSKQDRIDELEGQVAEVAEGKIALAKTQKSIERPLCRIQEELQTTLARSLGGAGTGNPLSAPGHDLEMDELVEHMDQANQDFALLRAVLEEEKANFEAQLKNARPSTTERAKIEAELKRKHEKEMEEALRNAAQGASQGADAQRKELENRLKKEEERASKLEAENKKLKDMLSEETKKCATLQAELDKLQKQIAGLKDDNEKQKKKLAARANEDESAEKAAEKRKAMEMQMKELKDKVAALTDENGELLGKLSKAEKRSKKMESDAENLQSANDELSSSVESLKASVEHLKKKLAKAKRERGGADGDGPVAEEAEQEMQEGQAVASSSEESEPEWEQNFLLPYRKRNKLGKRRWQSLNEDAEYARRKREYDYQTGRGMPEQDQQYSLPPQEPVPLGRETGLRPNQSAQTASPALWSGLGRGSNMAKALASLSSGSLQRVDSQPMTMVCLSNPVEDAKAAFSFLNAPTQRLQELRSGAEAPMPKPPILTVLPRQMAATLPTKMHPLQDAQGSASSSTAAAPAGSAKVRAVAQDSRSSQLPRQVSGVVPQQAKPAAVAEAVSSRRQQSPRQAAATLEEIAAISNRQPSPRQKQTAVMADTTSTLAALRAVAGDTPSVQQQQPSAKSASITEMPESASIPRGRAPPMAIMAATWGNGASQGEDAAATRRQRATRPPTLSPPPMHRQYHSPSPEGVAMVGLDATGRTSSGVAVVSKVEDVLVPAKQAPTSPHGRQHDAPSSRRMPSERQGPPLAEVGGVGSQVAGRLTADIASALGWSLAPAAAPAQDLQNAEPITAVREQASVSAALHWQETPSEIPTEGRAVDHAAAAGEMKAAEQRANNLDWLDKRVGKLAQKEEMPSMVVHMSSGTKAAIAKAGTGSFAPPSSWRAAPAAPAVGRQPAHPAPPKSQVASPWPAHPAARTAMASGSAAALADDGLGGILSRAAAAEGSHWHPNAAPSSHGREAMSSSSSSGALPIVRKTTGGRLPEPGGAKQSNLPSKSDKSYDFQSRWLAKERKEQLPFTNMPNGPDKLGIRSVSTPDLQSRFHSTAVPSQGFHPEALPPLQPGRVQHMR